MIFTITAIATGPLGRIIYQRVFGYFEKEHDAAIAIYENRGEMHEHLYKYLVVEECYPGVHAVSSVKKWYEWNHNGKQWDLCEWPSDIPPNTINFSMG